MKHRTTFAVGAQPTSVAAMLTWPVPNGVSNPAVRAAQTPIDPRENNAFTLSGDLWRVQVEENDCDYYLELSASGAGQTAPRVIVELPQDAAAVRSTLAAMIKDAGLGDLSTTSNLNFAQPLPLTVTGLAFWDGAHWSASDPQKGHGHGTPLVGTLWELHPVTSMQRVAPGPTAPVQAANATTTATATTATTTQTSTAPAPPVDKIPPGTVWYVKIIAPFNGKTQRVSVIRDPHADPASTITDLQVADDVRLTPAFTHLRKETLAYLRVNQTTVTRVEQLPTDSTRRTWTMLLLGAVLLLLLFFGRELLRGKDGPYSKSQVQAAVWFAVLVLAYVSTNLTRSHVAGTSLFGLVNIPAHLAMLSGISLFTFGAAKGIRVSQEKKAQSLTPQQQLPPPVRVPPHFPRDLFIDQDGHPDLGDVQCSCSCCSP